MLSKNPMSLVIIGIYLLALLYLFVSGAVPPHSVFVGILYSLGVMLGLWALYTMRATNWQITPEVANGAVLIENGPYTYIRHPMYLAVMLVSLGLILNEFTVTRLIAVIIIVAVLLVKIQLEEKHLHKAFPKYKDYMKKTFNLVPYIY